MLGNADDVIRKQGEKELRHVAAVRRKEKEERLAQEQAREQMEQEMEQYRRDRRNKFLADRDEAEMEVRRLPSTSGESTQVSKSF